MQLTQAEIQESQFTFTDGTSGHWSADLLKHPDIAPDAHTGHTLTCGACNPPAAHCAACGMDLEHEPNVGWVCSLSGDQGGTYDHCPATADHRHDVVKH